MRTSQKSLLARTCRDVARIIGLPVPPSVLSRTRISSARTPAGAGREVLAEPKAPDASPDGNRGHLMARHGVDERLRMRKAQPRGRLRHLPRQAREMAVLASAANGVACRTALLASRTVEGRQPVRSSPN